MVVAGALVLNGCSAALEQARSTYDPTKITAGAPRMQIEQELGKPVQTEPGDKGQVIVTYTTSRVTPAEKKSVVGGHIEGAIMTLGLMELVYIPGIVAEKEGRTLRVTYAADGTAVAITSRCNNATSGRAWTSGVWPSGFWLACANGAAPL
jgi:hypothetical protein